jgi:serine/threonine protein kinase
MSSSTISRSFEMNLEDWDLIRTIGRGFYGKVKLAKHKSSGAYSAIKVMNKNHLIKTKPVEHIHREYTLLAELSHPFIVYIP